MTGILLALVAMLGWGFADFFAQKAARKVGISTTLFFGSAFGALMLLPLAWSHLDLILVPRNAAILLLATAIGLFTALLSLEAFRRGKMAVIEPILGLELPITIALAIALRGERVSLPEILAFGAVFCGILLAATSKPLGARLRDGGRIERGVFLGLVGAVGLGASNFITGVASQDISPIIAVWFGRALFSVIFAAYLLVKGRLVATLETSRAHAGLLFCVASLYLVAFLAFAMATTKSPISVVTTISQCYIVLTVLLGVRVNKEKLTRHQTAGIAAAVVGILVLAALSA